MYRLLLLILAPALATVLLAACGGGGGGAAPAPPEPPEVTPPPELTVEFRREGLDGLTISRLYQEGDRLFAATDNGLYAKSLDGDNWQLIGLENHRLEDVAILDDQHLIAAAVFDPDPLRFSDPTLFESVNGGANWLPLDNDFGGGFEENIGVWALFYDAESQRLYATGQDALAVSEDTGRSWALISGVWDTLSQPKSALALNRGNGQIWYGGQNAIEQMVLRRVDLASGLTTEFSGFLLPSPATIEGITLDPLNPDRVIASGEGGILLTLDNGESWTAPLGDVDFRFYFQAVLDPQDSDVIYTASWVKDFDNPQLFVLEISRDGGRNWNTHVLDEPGLFGGAWSLLAVLENEKTVLYAGLQRGGIVKVLFVDGA